MQLMPATAATLARQIGTTVSPVALTFEPEQNMRLGTAYVHELLERFDNALPLALAAYNAGPHRVAQWLVENGDPRGVPTGSALAGAADNSPGSAAGGTPASTTGSNPAGAAGGGQAGIARGPPAGASGGGPASRAGDAPASNAGDAPATAPQTITPPLVAPTAASSPDMIDWIELIPFSETRNYVQRVLENVVIYRARSGEATPTLLAQWTR
jgi:soluble lytic murein transglycosylase-like protein